MKTTTIGQLLNQLNEHGEIKSSQGINKVRYYLGTGDHADSIYNIFPTEHGTARVRLVWDTREVSLDAVVEIRGWGI